MQATPTFATSLPFFTRPDSHSHGLEPNNSIRQWHYISCSRAAAAAALPTGTPAAGAGAAPGADHAPPARSAGAAAAGAAAAASALHAAQAAAADAPARRSAAAPAAAAATRWSAAARARFRRWQQGPARQAHQLGRSAVTPGVVTPVLNLVCCSGFSRDWSATASLFGCVEQTMAARVCEVALPMSFYA